MKSLPWVVTAAAVVIAVVGTNKLRESEPKAAPETPAKLIAAATADIEKKRPSDALRKVRKVPTSDRMSPAAREVEGEALFALHYANRAEAKWKEAIEQETSLESAPFRLFDLYFLSGRYTDARKLAVELAPKQLSFSYAAAMLLESIRQEHERPATPVCLEAFEPVLLREPDDGYALRTVGRCYVELGRITEGLQLLKAATEKQPNNAETWAILFESLHDAGRSAQVVELFPSAPDAVRKHSRVLRIAAAAFDAVGNAKAAEERLREAIVADPFDRKAHTQLAALLSHRGADAEAKKLVERAKELDELREKQAALLQQARNQNNDPAPELMQRLAGVCRDLGWKDVGDGFEQLANRRLRRASGAAAP